MKSTRLPLCTLAAAALITLAACQPPASPPAATATTPAPAPAITPDDVAAAQQAWGQALVAIGRAGADGSDARAVAREAISRLYAYDSGPVLFKPTLTHGAQTFRTTAEGALAYFAGGDPAFPDDSGFALKPWTAVRFQTAAFRTSGDIALWQGNMWVRDGEGNEVMVDKTFAYQRAADGSLRIVLHHSSLPFQPAGQ